MQNRGKYVLLTSAEYAEIIELWDKAGLSHRPLGRDSYENILRQMKEDNTKFIGRYAEGQLIGIAIVSHNGRKGWINRLAVHPDYRHHGHASGLIDFCEAWLQSEGIEIFAVLIESDNQTSAELFGKKEYVRHNDIIYYTKRKNQEV
jgi:N-acetylglutamate synthase